MNEVIEQARQVGLRHLQATEAQVQHGLELHAASVVVDGYGFAPRAAIDGEAYEAIAHSGATEAELSDLLEEMTMTRAAISPVEEKEFREAFEAAGVTCIFQNAGQEGNAPERLLKRLARFTYTTDHLRDWLPKAVTPADIIAAKAAGHLCLYFVGNGIPLAQRWQSVEEEVGFIRLFFQLGIRMMHLTYNRRNPLGEGCAEAANGGLSDLGRAAIAEMNRVGVTVDVAHSGWRTSLEAAQASTRPMVASHSACAALCPHHRCKPDEVIRAIADTGGYVGICAVPAFLGGTGTITSFLDHIDYIARNFGADHVAIGTDTAYSSRNMAAEYQKITTARPASRPFYESYWWENDPVSAAEWNTEELRQSLAWTNWPLFTVGLVQRGYSDEDIQKIIGGNVLRVAEAVL